MAVKDQSLTGVERYLSTDEFIVSKTDGKGLITYVNRVFTNIAGYEEGELLGKPHNIIRHPGMPRCVFKFLWDTIKQKKEVFAYVVNRCKNGDHYWVFAHVTASLDARGRILGYHSNRRAPDTAAIAAIQPVYQLLLDEEAKHSNPRDAAEAGLNLLVAKLGEMGLSYEEFVFSLSKEVA